MDAPDTSHVPKPDLFAKVGPLPAWGWGLILVVGYLGYRRFTAMRAPVANTDPNNVVQDASMVPTDSFSDGGGSGGGMTSVGPESSGYNYDDVLAGNYTGTTSGAVFNTNQQWGVYALNNMPKLGYPAGDVASAITFYLAGMPLTAAQRQIVQQAITSYGSPPLPLPLTDTPTAPVTPDPVVATPSPSLLSTILAPIQSIITQPTVDPVNPLPTPYAGATYDPSNPTVYYNPAQPTPSPSSPDIQTAIQEVGGGVATPIRTTVGGTRTLSSFDSYSQSQLQSGSTVVGGDGRVFKLVNGVPTSIGMYSEVV